MYIIMQNTRDSRLLFDFNNSPHVDISDHNDNITSNIAISVYFFILNTADIPQNIRVKFPISTK